MQLRGDIWETTWRISQLGLVKTEKVGGKASHGERTIYVDTVSARVGALGYWARQGQSLSAKPGQHNDKVSAEDAGRSASPLISSVTSHSLACRTLTFLLGTTWPLRPYLYSPILEWQTRPLTVSDSISRAKLQVAWLNPYWERAERRS